MTEKVLICYGTRYGSTAEVAAKIAETVRNNDVDVELVNLKKEKLAFHIPDYNLVIVGRGIQAGSWTKEPRRFIKDNLDALLKTRLALFVVCGDAANPEQCESAQSEYLDKIVMEYPGLTPISTGLFPGVFDFKKYNFAVRALVKSILKRQLEPGEELPEGIDFRDWDKIREWTVNLF